MIGFFPTAYPDELLYSQICRYHVRSGSVCYRSTADDIYRHAGTVRPDFEFVNAYTADALSHICRDTTIADVIMTRTMFPAYARFLPKMRKSALLDALCSGEGNIGNLLLGEKCGARYAMYCPMCADNDRRTFGEAYWHRTHQVRSITVCPTHGCYLERSFVLSGKASPCFHDAESELPRNAEARLCDNEAELAFARYADSVFSQAIDVRSDTQIGQYLTSKLDAKYLIRNGLQRNLVGLYEDMTAYYGDGIVDFGRLTKVFNGYRFNNADILRIALFEGISASEIASPPSDDRYGRIAAKYGLTPDTVRMIEKDLTADCTHTGGAKRKDRTALDSETLPKVRSAVRRLGSGNERPKKLSTALVAGEIGLAPKTLASLPKCMAYIGKRSETYAAFHAREIEWVYSTHDREAITIYGVKSQMTDLSFILAQVFLGFLHIN